MQKGRTKFNVTKTKTNNIKRQAQDFFTGETITFDSELECKYYKEIVVAGLLDGTVTQCKLQQKYILIPSFKYQGKTIREMSYISDFDVLYSDGRFEVIDTKGFATADAKLKAKLMKYTYPNITFKWMSYTKATGWVEYDELQSIRRKNKKNKSLKG